MKMIDTLITARWIAPVHNDTILENHAVAVDNGKIIDILPVEHAEKRYRATHRSELTSHLLIPGLINTHTHTSMSLFRGMADDLPLMTWLNEYIWPAEQNWVSEDLIADGTRLAIAEMIRGGTTCFNDMYFFPETTARIALHTGMRATVGIIVFNFPSAWGDGPADYLRKGLILHDELRGNPLVQVAFAPHAPYTVADEHLTYIQTLVDELSSPIPVHMHLHETRDEISGSLAEYAMRPMQRLNELGLLTPQFIAVHMTHLTDEEIALAVETGIHVAHCPESNLKLASGFCPVTKLQQAGVNVCIGTDGAASNNDLDMIGEMRSAALLAKGVAEDARAMPAMAALRAATLNGAKALGIDATTGSIEKGKAADLTAINLDSLATAPVFHPVSQLVYAASRDQVSDVWIAGKQVLNNSRLTTLDEEAVLKRARYWREKIVTGKHH